ncbi:MAG: alkane 1-monooxygenase [Pseudotabrizicola sp.]|uniref:alkane 1-monooxygenase n=3 Tax=Pseudotabrizicola sp. TaxID=2939647 RepID=UPI002730E76E|nr:alkane 1-monooxygenase [Pseudotabrizicola sp.]MDP2082480.1 alkane 1-monooxygenase [Pseudotabrizicola sp.]MDZ7572786.1 alkane 1-monooxygenase [Pseudotabrizicola sp.]
MTDRPRQKIGFAQAMPFWLTLGIVPLALIGATYGGWFTAVVPVYSILVYSSLDALTGLNERNADPETPDEMLFWYQFLTLIWPPVQMFILFGTIWYAAHTSHLSGLELGVLFFGIGIVTGTIGINYSHELMHQKNKLERWLADILLASVLYSHFRSEHLRVHHTYVGTCRDPVTARYNEGFHRFFPRVLRQSPVSAWRAEAAMLARRGLPWWHRSNPFWRYGALQAAMLMLAIALGGWLGLGLFVYQAAVAIWQLEAVNYVEHYGLTRRHLGDGKYEHVKPHHSWNASHTASNWLLINLQRHSDHHFKPDRRFPLLQTYGEDQAPQLPLGYPLMVFIAMNPLLWRRMMNPRVRAWRKFHYPDITDWKPYNKALNPPPR